MTPLPPGVYRTLAAAAKIPLSQAEAILSGCTVSAGEPMEVLKDVNLQLCQEPVV